MQDFLDQFTDYLFVIYDQASPVHVTLRILTIALTPGPPSPGGRQPRICESVQIEVEKRPQMCVSLCLLGQPASGRRSRFRPQDFIAVELYANSQLAP